VQQRGEAAREKTPHPITPSPLPSPLGRGKRGRGVGLRGLVNMVKASRLLTPGNVKLLLPPRQSRGNSPMISRGKRKVWKTVSHGQENATIFLRIFPMGRKIAACRALFGTTVAHMSNGVGGNGVRIRDTGYGARAAEECEWESWRGHRRTGKGRSQDLEVSLRKLQKRRIVMCNFRFLQTKCHVENK